MEYKLKLNEQFNINKDVSLERYDGTTPVTVADTALSYDLSKVYPLKIDVIYSFTVNDGKSNFSAYSVGDVVPYSNFVAFNSGDYQDPLYLQAESALITNGLCYDPVSGRIIAGNVSYVNDEDVFIPLINEEIGDRLMTNGNGVYFDKNLNICKINEDCEITTIDTWQEGGLIDGGIATRHTLSPFKTYVATSQGVSKLYIEWDSFLPQMNNIHNYSFSGLVKVYKEGAIFGSSHLNVSLPENVTAANRYKYESGNTYSYTIYYDYNSGSWLYESDAPLSVTNTETPDETQQ